MEAKAGHLPLDKTDQDNRSMISSRQKNLAGPEIQIQLL